MFVNVDWHFPRCRPTLALSRILSFSVSLPVCLLSVRYKNPSSQMLIIIEIQDSVVFGCSHFIGSTNTKISFGYLWKNTIQHLSFLPYHECHKIIIFLIREKKATHFSKAIIWIHKVHLRHFWKRLYTPIWTYSIQKTKQYIWLSQLFESKHKITMTQWLT